MGVKLGKLSIPNIRTLLEFPEFEITAELVSDNWNNAYDTGIIETPWALKAGDKIVSMDCSLGVTTVPVNVGFTVAPPNAVIPTFTPDVFISGAGGGSPAGEHTQVWNRVFGSDGSTLKILEDGLVIYLTGDKTGGIVWPTNESRFVRISAFR